ncbi:MAG: hypothetical protein Q9169_005757 [Polycauliona sp. 2 TL-2023]
MANVTSTSASSISVDNTVLWPTIVWGLLPIAFNSMTQPVGRIAVDIAANHSFYLRASPFICILEAFAVLCQFAYFTIQTGSPRWAIRRISRTRFYSPTHVASTQWQELQSNDVFRAILFLVGVCPQAVKLYACRGIPASKAWVTLYLVSWTVLELLVVLPARYGAFEDLQNLSSEPRPSDVDGVVDFLCAVAVHYCDFMALHFMQVQLKKERQSHNPPLPPMEWRDYVGLTGAMTFYSLLLCARIAATAAAAFETFLYFFYAILLFNFSIGESLWVFALRLGRFVAVVGINEPKEEDEPFIPSLKHYSQTGSVAFFLTHVLTAVGAYVFMYDPAGTSKPGWTKYLG